MGGLKSGERLLIHAAAGGVGIAATHVAKGIGAEIFGTASASKHDAIRAQGVAHAIDYRNLDFAEEAMRITGGIGLDLIIDALDDAGHSAFVVERVRTGIAADPRLGGRLALWGRRLMGEALTQAQRVAAERDALSALLAGGVDRPGLDLAALGRMFSRLTERHAQRMADLGLVSAAITRYHDGELGAVDAVPVRQRSGPFLEHAWDVLRTVPAGAPVSYTEYAAKAGRPAAVRAAASACARNATALFVPCHRVLRSDGSLGGYLGGLDAKRTLLDLETTGAGVAAP